MKRAFVTGICLLFALALLGGCGGREEELTVRCACGEDYYTLPLEQKGTSDGGSNGISFEIDMSLSQLKTLIDGTDTGSARLKRQHLFPLQCRKFRHRRSLPPLCRRGAGSVAIRAVSQQRGIRDGIRHFGVFRLL